MDEWFNVACAAVLASPIVGALGFASRRHKNRVGEFSLGFHLTSCALACGRSVHVGGAGTGQTYLAVYTANGTTGAHTRWPVPGSLSHIGVVVDDLAAIEYEVASYA